MSYLWGELAFDSLFVVDCIGHSGGLALFWNEGIDLEIQNYFARHISAVIKEMGRDFQ
jgi:hypothetical protein